MTAVSSAKRVAASRSSVDEFSDASKFSEADTVKNATVKDGRRSPPAFASPSTLAFFHSNAANNLRASPVSPEPDMSTNVITLHSRSKSKSKTTTRQEPYILPVPAAPSAPVAPSSSSMNMLVHASLAHLLDPSRPQDQQPHQQPQPPTKKKVGRPKKDKSAIKRERKPKLAKATSNKPKGVKYCNKQIDKWNIRYEEAKVYAKTNGHCMIPNEYPDNPLLGGWAKRQRYQYQVLKKGETNKIHPNGSRNSSISLERIHLLEDIGFCWQHKDHKWHARYAELVKFVKEYGHAAVPTTYDDNQGLAGWVKVQRRQYKLFALHKKSSMTQARIKLLNKVDFCWSIKETAELPPGLEDKIINGIGNNGIVVEKNAMDAAAETNDSSSSPPSQSATDALTSLKDDDDDDATPTTQSQRTKRQEPNGENAMEEDIKEEEEAAKPATKVEAMEEDIKKEDAISALLSFAR